MHVHYFSDIQRHIVTPTLHLLEYFVPHGFVVKTLTNSAVQTISDQNLS